MSESQTNSEPAKKRTTMMCYVDDDLKQRVRAFAAQERRTISSAVAFLVDKGLDACAPSDPKRELLG